MHFGELLINQTTVLLAGVPDAEYFSLIQNVTDVCLELEVPAKLVWGAHMTVARFHGAVGPDSGIERVFALMSAFDPVFVSRPDAVDVGWYTAGPEGVWQRTYERFPLSTRR